MSKKNRKNGTINLRNVPRNLTYKELKMILGGFYDGLGPCRMLCELPTGEFLGINVHTCYDTDACIEAFGYGSVSAGCAIIPGTYLGTTWVCDGY